MEIYEALKKDHEEVKNLLNDLCSLKEDDDYRMVLIEEIRNHLIPHSRAEESVFYNTMRAVDADKKVVFHGFKEHLEAEALLRALQLMDKTNLQWKDTAEKLREAIFHHVEEEESDIFAEAKSIFSQAEAEAMGEAFEELKPKFEQDGAMKNTLDMVINLLPPRLSDKLRDLGGARS